LKENKKKTKSGSCKKILIGNKKPLELDFSVLAGMAKIKIVVFFFF
jgi:hypothetical protein